MITLIRAPIALLVLLYQSILLALSQVWANKMRSILTTVGIIIGVASVSAVIAALSGMKKSVLDQFESFGTNKVFIYPSFPQTGLMRTASRNRIMLQPAEFNDLLTHCPSLRSFTRLTQAQLTISYQQKSEQNLQVQGIDPAWHDIEQRLIIQGRPFSLIDDEQSRPVCIINPALQTKLGLPNDCTGYSIAIGPRRYRIIGVLEPRASSIIGRSDPSDSEVYVPFSTLYSAMGGRAYMTVTAASISPDLSEEATGEISFYLRQRRHIKPGQPDTFRVQFVSQFVENFNKVANTMTAVAVGIVGISLLVGGVGIMNIMLVSVSERTREIGLRKAVGARPSAILLQFLVEAVFLCFLGGLVGLGIGQGMTMVLAHFEQIGLQNSYIPGWAIALSFGFSAMVGLIFGMFPAIKAARLDPIEALRHE